MLGVDSPNLTAKLLMQFVLNKPRQYIVANDLVELSKEQEKIYLNGIERIKAGIPIGHITHQKEFMKMNFFVDENVLIPRQDTEILVEEVIKIAKENNFKNILDLCTGSGAIAVSLARYIPNSEITASDISNKALQIAKRNAISNDVENQITFVSSDMFTNIVEEKFDIIVSNPPYIKSKVINELEENVKKEPHIALDGGEDGLDFYRRIIKKGYQYLKFGGYLCLEIGYDQREDVIKLIEDSGIYKNTYFKKDLYGNDRIVITKV